MDGHKNASHLEGTPFFVTKGDHLIDLLTLWFSNFRVPVFMAPKGEHRLFVQVLRKSHRNPRISRRSDVKNGSWRFSGALQGLRSTRSRQLGSSDGRGLDFPQQGMRNGMIPCLAPSHRFLASQLRWVLQERRSLFLLIGSEKRNDPLHAVQLRLLDVPSFSWRKVVGCPSFTHKFVTFRGLRVAQIGKHHLWRPWGSRGCSFSISLIPY